MKDRIYIRTNGKMDELEEQRFPDEDAIQALIAKHPDLVGGGRITPNEPRRWILIRREQGVPDTEESPGRWSVDVLLLDQDAIPTIVEVKRGSNTQLRREVVGQVLEYAAHARHTWDAAELRRTFEAQPDWEDKLRDLLVSEDAPDADSFWKDVGTNLRASNLRLLIVADAIPDELARVVEFLNEQMKDVEVLAVEVKRYASKDSETFVPSVIGALAAPQSKSKAKAWGRMTFPTAFSDPAHRDAAQRLLDAAKEAGGSYLGYPSGMSIRANVPGHPTPVTVAWLLAPGNVSTWQPVREFAFGAGNATKPDFFDDLPGDAGRVLKKWADQFADDAFTCEDPRTELQTAGVVAWCVSYDDAAKQIDTLVGRLKKVLADLKALEPPEETGTP